MLQNNYEVTLTLTFQSNNSKYVSLFSVNYLTDLTYLTEENYLTERKEMRPLIIWSNFIKKCFNLGPVSTKAHVRYRCKHTGVF